MKREAEAFTQRKPGQNEKRAFVNAMLDINKSPVDFDRTSARPQITDGIFLCDERFNPFN